MLLDAAFPFLLNDESALLEYDLIDDAKLYDQQTWRMIVVLQDADFKVLEGNSFGATEITWSAGVVLGGEFTAIQLSKGVISAYRDNIHLRDKSVLEAI